MAEDDVVPGAGHGHHAYVRLLQGLFLGPQRPVALVARETVRSLGG